jgi:hypothetical protein
MNTSRTFLIAIIAATAASTLPCLVACGGSPEDDAEAEAQADTAAAASFQQYGTHEYPSQGAAGASAAGASPASPDAHNTAKCSAARPPKNATLNNLGGPLLNHAKVYNIGYGAVNDGSTLNAFTKWLVDSTYVTDLGEYGVGAATFKEGFQGAATTTRTVTDSQIQGFVARLINSGRLPLDGTDQSLYMVYTSPGVTVVNDHGGNSRSCRDFCGYHGAFGFHPDAFINQTVYYAVIPDTGACVDACWVGSNLGDREKTVSHELAEALTDPNFNAWKNVANHGAEIGDLCNSAFYSTSHGYIAQCEWSNRHGGCVNNTP